MIFIGSVSIQNISGSGTVQFGHTVNRSISSAKTITGAGAENEGMLVIANSVFSQTTSSPTTLGPTISGPTTSESNNI